MTPSFIGRTAMMPSGVRPSMRLASSPMPLIFGGLLDRDDRGLVQHDAFALDVDQGVGRAEIDGDLVRGEPGNQIQAGNFHRGAARHMGAEGKWHAVVPLERYRPAAAEPTRASCSRRQPRPAGSHSLHPRDDHLRDAHAPGHLERLGAQIHQRHHQLAPVIAVDRGRSVRQRDAMRSARPDGA